MSVKWYGKEVESKIDLATKAGLTVAAMLVQGQAKLLCPVDLGRLRNSITYRIGMNEASIGTNLEYAPYVEFGTGIYAEGGGRQTPWVYFDEKEKKFFRTRGRKPKPYLRPALDENKQEIIDLFQKEYKKKL